MQTPEPRATLELSGRIASSSRGGVNVLTTPQVSGRITATSRGRSETLAIRQLTGRIAATSQSRSNVLGSRTLIGRIRASSQGQSVLTPAVQLPLTGRIRASSSARIIYSTSVWDGVVRSTSRGRSNLLTLSSVETLVLSGTINTTSQARLRRPTLSVVSGALQGRIRTTSQSLAATRQSLVSGNFAGQIRTTSRSYNTEALFPSPSILQGTITTRSFVTLSALPISDLVGTIRTTAWAGLDQANRRFGASILNTTALRVGQLQLRTLLEGQINTHSWASLPVTQALLSGTIRATSFVRIPNLPLLPQAGPITCPVDVDLIRDYVSLITSEHINRPKYRQTVINTVQPYVDDQKMVGGLPCLFDVDIAVGEQEDFTGQWIGKTRYVTLGDVFFSWDVEGLGWDEANWRGPFDPENMLARLDDYHYRLLLYASIVANRWDGSVPSAYTAWDTLFYGTGYQVVIQDYGNMTMMLGLRGSGPIDVVTQALFSNGHMDLKPEGVSLIDYVFQAEPGVPFFAFDAQTDAASGWDIGYWGHLVPPGQGFIPEAELAGEEMSNE